VELYLCPPPPYAVMAWSGTNFYFCAHSCRFLKQKHKFIGKCKNTNPTLQTAGEGRQNPRLLSKHLVNTVPANVCESTSSVSTTKRLNPSAREHKRSGQKFGYKKRFKFRPDASSRPYCFPGNNEHGNCNEVRAVLTLLQVQATSHVT
jgi:hypothetical protein